jgi:hypothetical protein
MSVMKTLRRVRQEDVELQASLDKIARPYLTSKRYS